METKFIPKAPDAAAGNEDIILQELPVLRIEITKKVIVFYSAMWAVLRCAWLYRGEGRTATRNIDQCNEMLILVERKAAVNL